MSSDGGIAARRVWIVTVIVAAISVSVIAWDAGRHLSGGLANSGGEELGRDFAYFWSGARLAMSGHAAQVYDILKFFSFERSVFGANAEFKFYGYSPIFLLLTALIGLLPYVIAFAVWICAGTVFCAWLLARNAGWRWAITLSVGAPASFLNFYAGQNGQFTAVLLASGLMALERRPTLAGIAFGLLSFKPQLGILLPVALIASGKWRTLAVAAATCLLVASASLLIFGAEVWLDFLRQTGLQRMLLETESMNWPRMPTVFTGMRLLGFGLTVAYLFQGISAVIAALVVGLIWRSDATTAIKRAALIVGGFLVTPYAWDYDMVIITFAVVWLANGHRIWIEGRWERIVLGALLLLPLVEVIFARKIGLPVAPVLLWIVMTLVAWHGSIFSRKARMRGL